MTDLAVVILTFNEERHIGRALEAIKGIAKQVFVVDSFSTDRTVEIAKERGAVVLTNKFVNYAKQFEWALSNAPITSGWVMRLDADEFVEPDLVAEITAKLPSLAADVVGINLKRRHIFFGRWIRFGGRYPLILLRIWRRGQGRIEQRWMDEHIIVWGGRTVTFDCSFADINLNDLTFFTEKHNKYATREAVDILNQKHRLFETDDVLNAQSASLQASLKRIVKVRIYNRLPFWMGPMIYFLYRYLFQFGFLDGMPGLIYHFLQGGWYRFLVAAKVIELERELVSLPDAETKLARLRHLTGLAL